jgi:hypothetical protein
LLKSSSVNSHSYSDNYQQYYHYELFIFYAPHLITSHPIPSRPHLTVYRRMNEAADLVERDLTVVGASAIEDKLQVGGVVRGVLLCGVVWCDVI